MGKARESYYIIRPDPGKIYIMSQPQQFKASQQTCKPRPTPINAWNQTAVNCSHKIGTVTMIQVASVACPRELFVRRTINCQWPTGAGKSLSSYPESVEP
jgi:hypothetical protein